ncbi:hypothetical protein LTR08_008288 [Meristemomyces frigidus]|nr:hypothetical protein LTR08_008288 [Meristemomyces frigidus]
MSSTQERLTIRDLGYIPGTLQQGPSNSLLDVPGVHISQITVETAANLKPGSTASKGVTIILPRGPKDFYVPCHAGTFTFNGNGEVTGSRQIADWGFTNTPIAFTNSLSLGTVFDGVWDWVLDQQDKLGWDELTRARHYGTPVVGETADWIVNCQVRDSRLEKTDIKRAFESVKSRENGGFIQEGHAGGGAGMTCHMYAGGTGTSSRLVGNGEGGAKQYTLGVLCQSNYGTLSQLVIGGVPVGRILQKEKDEEAPGQAALADADADVHAPAGVKEHAGRAKDGSILVLIITDAPLATHQLQRLARHATGGLALVGTSGIGRTFSGDIFTALSTAEHGPEQLENFKRGAVKPIETYTTEVVKNESIDGFFVACQEATEEAILNSMVGGREGTVAMDGVKVDGMPVDKVKELLKRYLVTV